MKYSEVSAIAKSRKIHPAKHSKTELIKLIQAGEGNFDCYGTAWDGQCDQADCMWREDCFEAAQQGE